MRKPSLLIAAGAILASIGAPPLLAQDGPNRAVRPYTAWYYDGRDDPRDFPTNGFFPGDFAANPPGAAISATGLFGFTPYRSAAQPVYGLQPEQIACARRHRSYDAASDSFLGNDGAWHRCR
jgi:hypothetical protein